MTDEVKPTLESKKAYKERLKREGQWPEAVDFREGLKAAGVSPGEAHRRTVEAFQPLDNTRSVYSPPIKAKRPKEVIR